MKQLCYNLFFASFLIMLHNVASASIHKNIWSKWEVNNPLSHDMISHHEWQTFLDLHVQTNREGITLVDYTTMSKKDLELLNSYIERMSRIKISDYNRREQLAYWINLYNALTVQTVMRFYPVTSIQDINISPGLFSVGPWGAKMITIDNTLLSLDDIQNRIIRPIWNDPRIHYALNNAAIGAANLGKQAYQGHSLEKQLNDAASDYINSLRGVQVVEGKLIASKIYEWYLEDFGDNEHDLIRHLNFFAKEPLKEHLKQCKHISAYIYNWHLNGTVHLS
ncbi:DUF547 domain-containing protein [Legionella londiniensis]|uniref:Putative Ser/Thr protein kinase n=2 Tax=Legionella londiniensis TaxID=45068 RepID=A0A0W0VT36_9GAMM|nr:DUF547 domain-containing protein [Legionella londiniensis]KTD23351.1 putative Ser/Thr protein kinase [Legionella londiniensis]STX94094.1 putative Ser/Thr protein kinase [Legionella londiniensis]